MAEKEDALFASFISATQEQDESHCQSAERADSARVAKAEDYLLAHLTEPVSRGELAAEVGTSFRHPVTRIS